MPQIRLLSGVLGAVVGMMVAGILQPWLALPTPLVAPFGAFLGILVGVNYHPVLDKSKGGLEIGYLGEMLVGATFGALLGAIPGIIAGLAGGVSAGLLERSWPLLVIGPVFGVLFSVFPNAALGALVGAALAAVLRLLEPLLSRLTFLPLPAALRARLAASSDERWPVWPFWLIAAVSVALLAATWIQSLLPS